MALPGIIPPEPVVEPGLVLQLFELAGEIADSGRIRYRCVGLCMYPCIKPGDILHVNVRPAAQIQPGQIAVFRKNNRLYSHRAIDSRTLNGRPCIITRPDNGPANVREVTPDGDVLGIVSRIERNGRFLGTGLRNPGAASIAFLHALTLALRWRGVLSDVAIGGIKRIQPTSIYRRAASAALSRSGLSCDFTVIVPLNRRKTDRFHRTFSPGDFSEWIVRKPSPLPEAWSLNLRIDGRPTASVRVSFNGNGHAGGRWRIDMFWVRTLLRGSGIEDRLLRKLETLLAATGIARVYMEAEATDIYRVRLLKALGYRPDGNRPGNKSSEGPARSVIFLGKNVA